MEIFSISGAGFGQEGGCPPGWVTTPQGNCGSGAAKFRHPQAVKLQKALTRAGFPVSVDGIIGPQTAEAVNSALGTTLSPYQVAEQAASLTAQMGTAPPVPTPPGVQPGPPPVPATPPITRPRSPTAGLVALLSVNVIAATLGAWFASVIRR